MDLFEFTLSQDTFESVTQFGVAGLMGVLWVWERMHSRQRDTQLTTAHRQIVDQRERLGVMVEMIRSNAEALERMNQTHSRLMQLIEALSQRMENTAPHQPTNGAPH